MTTFHDTTGSMESMLPSFTRSMHFTKVPFAQPFPLLLCLFHHAFIRTCSIPRFFRCVALHTLLLTKSLMSRSHICNVLLLSNDFTDTVPAARFLVSFHLSVCTISYRLVVHVRYLSIRLFVRHSVRPFSRPCTKPLVSQIS